VNKEIEKFAKQSQIEIWGTNEINGSPKFLGHDIDVEKFADLLIRECANIIQETRWMVQPSQEQIARSVKQHFGVKD
jgi:hypothetical protein